MYVLNYFDLRMGDIILLRTLDRTCERIRELAKSQYSHAIIYQGNFSCLESHVWGVKSLNPQRIGVSNPNDILILRLKEDLSDFEMIQIINAAKRKVAISYASRRELSRSYQESLENAIEANRQFCTRFVAQSFEEGGFPIVPNSDYCSPRDIEQSLELKVIPDMVRLANSEEEKLVLEENTLVDIQEQVTYLFFENVRAVTASDIQSFQQLDEFLESNPDFDTEVSRLLTESGYLNLCEKSEEMTPELYDFEKFKMKFDKESRLFNAMLNIQGEEQRINDSQEEWYRYTLLYVQTQCNYFKLMMELSIKLQLFAHKRLSVWKGSLAE